MNITVWYLGGKSIQEVPEFRFATGVGGVKNFESKKCYLFIDPGLNQYSYFLNFSDTARLIRTFTGKNPIPENGGWDLYSDQEFQYDSKEPLRDTTINSVLYNRWRFKKLNDGKETQYVLFANCKVKNKKILYMRPFSKKFGCPVSRMEIFFEGELKAVSEFKQISDTLTKDELNVFNTWEKRLSRKKAKR